MTSSNHNGTNGGLQDMQADLDAILDYIGGQLDSLDLVNGASGVATTKPEIVVDSCAEVTESPPAKYKEDEESLVAFERLSCSQTEAILIENGLLLNQSNEHSDNEAADCDTLPVRVQACMSFLVERALTTEGIFRKCGLKNRVKTLHEKLPQIPDDTCVHDAADWLKAWARAAGPLLCASLLRSLLNTPFELRKWRALLLLQFGICRGRQSALQRLLLFLNKFSTFGDVSGMNARNLSICWAPAILSPGEITSSTELNQSLAAQLADARSLLQTLIEKAPLLFSAPRPHGLSPALARGEVLTASAKQLIPAAPQDILSRLLYQRQRWDPLISEWRIITKDEDRKGERDKKSNDTLSLVVVAPSGERRALRLQRSWSAEEGQLVLNEKVVEDGAEYLSTWSMRPCVRDAKCSVIVSVRVTSGGEGLMLLGGRTRSQLIAALERLVERQIASVLQSFELPAVNGTHVTRV